MSIKVDIQPDTSGIDSALRRLAARLRGVQTDVNSVKTKLDAGRLRVDTRQAKTSIADVNKELIKLNNKVESTTGSMRRAFNSLAISITAAFSTGAIIKGLTQASDAMTNYGNRIALVTGRTQEAIDVQLKLQNIARQSNGAMNTAVETFNRFGLSLQATNKYSLNDLLNNIQGVGKASGQVNELAIVVQSVEESLKTLNSTLAESPELAEKLAEAMKISPIELGELLQEGTFLKKAKDFGDAFSVVFSDEALNKTKAQRAAIEQVAAAIDSGVAAQGRLDQAFDSNSKVISKLTESYSVNREELMEMLATGKLTTESILSSFKELNRYSTEDLLKVTETVQKAVAISGGSAESANAAIIQLGQGLGSGTLRGEELNSVMEQTPRLAQAIADGMGMTRAQMRLAAQDGQVTSEQVMKALLGQGEVVNQEFQAIEATVAQTAIAMRDAFTPVLGDIDKELGFSSALKKAMNSVTDYLTANRSQIATTVGKIKVDVLSAFTTISNAIRAVVDRIAAILTKNKSVRDFFSSLTEGVKNIPTAFVAMKRTLGTALGEFDRLFNQVRNLATDRLSRVASIVANFAKTVERWFWWVYDKVIGHSWWTDLMVETEQLADKHLSATLTKVKSFAKSVSSAFAKAYNTSKNKAIGILPSWDEFTSDVDRYVGYTLNAIASGISRAWGAMFDITPTLAAVLSSVLAGVIIKVFSKDLASKWVKLNWTTALLLGLSYVMSKVGDELINSGMLGDMASAMGKAIGQLGQLMIKNAPLIIEALQQIAKGFVSSFFGQFGFIGDIVGGIVSAVDKTLPGEGLLSSILFGAGLAAVMGKLDSVLGIVRNIFGIADKGKKGGKSDGGLIESILLGSGSRKILGSIFLVSAAVNGLTGFFNTSSTLGSAMTMGGIGLLLFGRGGVELLLKSIDHINSKIAILVGGAGAKAGFSIFEAIYGKPKDLMDKAAIYADIQEKIKSSIKIAQANKGTDQEKRFLNEARELARSAKQYHPDFIGPALPYKYDIELNTSNLEKIKKLLNDKLAKPTTSILSSIVATSNTILDGLLVGIRTKAAAAINWINSTVGRYGLLGRVLFGGLVATAALVLWSSMANAATGEIPQHVSVVEGLLPIGLLGLALVGPALGARALNLFGGILGKAASMLAATRIGASVASAASGLVTWITSLTIGAIAGIAAGAIAAGGLLLVWLFGEGDGIMEKLQNTFDYIRYSITGVTSRTRQLRKNTEGLMTTKKVGDINTDLSKQLSKINLGGLSDKQINELRKELVAANKIFSKNQSIYESEGYLTRLQIEETNKALSEANGYLQKLAEEGGGGQASLGGQARRLIEKIDIDRAIGNIADSGLLNMRAGLVKGIEGPFEAFLKDVLPGGEESRRSKEIKFWEARFKVIKDMIGSAESNQDYARIMIELLNLKNSFKIDNEALGRVFGKEAAVAINQAEFIGTDVWRAVATGETNNLDAQRFEQIIAASERQYKINSGGLRVDRDWEEDFYFKNELMKIERLLGSAALPRQGEMHEQWAARLRTDPSFGYNNEDSPRNRRIIDNAIDISSLPSDPALAQFNRTAITAATSLSLWTTGLEENLSYLNSASEKLSEVVEFPKVDWTQATAGQRIQGEAAFRSYQHGIDMANQQLVKDTLATSPNLIDDKLLKGLGLDKSTFANIINSEELSAELSGQLAKVIDSLPKTPQYLQTVANLGSQLVSDIQASIDQAARTIKPNINMMNFQAEGQKLLQDFSSLASSFGAIKMPQVDIQFTTPEQVAKAWDQVQSIEKTRDALRAATSIPKDQQDATEIRRLTDNFSAELVRFAYSFATETSKIEDTKSFWDEVKDEGLVDTAKILIGSPEKTKSALFGLAQGLSALTAAASLWSNLGFSAGDYGPDIGDARTKLNKELNNAPGWTKSTKDGGGDKRTWWEKFNENIGAMNLPVDSDYLAGISADTLRTLVSTSEKYKQAQEAINKSAADEVTKRQQSLELMRPARLEAIDALRDGTIEGQNRWVESLEVDVDTSFLNGLNDRVAELGRQTLVTIYTLREQLKTMAANSVEARITQSAIDSLTRSLEAAQSGAETMKSALSDAIQSFLTGGATFKEVMTGLLDTFTSLVIQKFTESFTNTLWDALDLDSFFAKMFGSISKAGDSMGAKAGNKLLDILPLSDKEGGGEEGAGFLSGLSNIFQGFSSTLSGLFGSLGSMFTNLIGSLGSMLGSIGSGIGSFFSILGFAEGGQISGPGTGTSDSILARVSNGEFIVNAAATRQWLPMLQAINSGKGPRLSFATGGHVGPVDSSALSSIPSRSGGTKQEFNIQITGDINEQTKKEIYRMLPEIAAGVNSHNRGKGYK